MTPLLRTAASASAVSAAELLEDRTALVVLAPHPDDETLGCGALLYEASKSEVACTVVCMTNGSKSHPNSPTWSAERLASVRRLEMTAAVGSLGERIRLVCLNYPDCETPDGGEAARACVAQLDTIIPAGSLLLSTWCEDPHVDHERSAALSRSLAQQRPDVAILFYPIWGRFNLNCSPTVSLASVRTLSASPEALTAKRHALSCYRTQMTALIDDDPTGFVMSAAHQVHFLEHPEIYLAG